MKDDLNRDLSMDSFDAPVEIRTWTKEEIWAEGRAQAEKSSVFIAKKMADTAALTDETKNAVIAGEIPCPICRHGSGHLPVCLWDEKKKYAERRSRDCWCREVKQTAMTIADYVPSGYRHMTGALKPCEKSKASIAFQQRVIDLLILKPNASYAFFGPAGVGKTALSMWLMIEWIKMLGRCGTYPGGYVNLEDGRGCGQIGKPFRSSASKLVREHHAYITADDKDEAEEPAITVGKLSDSAHPMVWLAEFEKIGPMTEYKYEVLFSIVDELYEKRPSCQLVMDSNLQLGEFEEYFTDKINRRIAELCYVVDYFSEEIQAPTDELMK
jgi:DNA replication protein DnaC